MIGFTGTHIGMKPAQMDATFALLRSLLSLYPESVLRHGDCVGADAEADAMASLLGIPRIAYPCTLESMRAHRELRGARLGDDPRPPRSRNARIVALSTVLVAAPRTPKEVVRSGTWMTVRIAERAQKTVWIVWPDGRVEARQNR